MPTTRTGRSSTPRGRREDTAVEDPESPQVIADVGGLLVGETINRGENYPFTLIISKIIFLCGFPADSTMVRYIGQQEWTELEDVTMIDVADVKDFYTVRDDGKFEAKPMLIHLRKFKAFLLYYMRRGRDFNTTLAEDDVLDMTVEAFKSYCGSADFHADAAIGSSPAPTNANTRVHASTNAVVGTPDLFTAQEFRRGVKRDKAHYADLKEDKYFSTWNRGFVATAHMHHTNKVLDEMYFPTSDIEMAVFKEMQTFMYAVLEEHLKTDKGKSLVSQFESTRDAQSIYRELKKHALSSTAAQLSGDTLLQYITTTRFPGNWRGTAYAFVLHWKEQVMKYETLEIEEFPPKQKLRMLQNAVGDVTELSYIKQISDQDVARGNPPLVYDGYMELLLSACSTYDKKITLPGKQKRAVYSTAISIDDGHISVDDTLNGEYAVFTVDTDVSDIMVNATNSNRFGNRRATNNGKPKSNFLPRDEWNKLTQEQKDQLIAKRRE
jgi:hypothetical protein